jgi:uncharacterized protein (DUF952 family)
MLIYKIFRAGEYAVVEAASVTKGAPLDVSDGYIHFSTTKTVLETANKYFAGIEGLKLVVVESDRLGDDMKWERAQGGVLFLHLYRVLTRDEVAWMKDMPATVIWTTTVSWVAGSTRM